MRKYLTGLEIKKKIIKALKEGPVSLRKLETKLNIGYTPLRRHCKELEYLRIVKITKTSLNSKNGRSYSIVELTGLGKGI